MSLFPAFLRENGTNCLPDAQFQFDARCCDGACLEEHAQRNQEGNSQRLQPGKICSLLKGGAGYSRRL